MGDFNLGPFNHIQKEPLTVKVTLKKLSICPCGFPLLKDSIGLGAEYEIEEHNRMSCHFQCGGCHSLIKSVECVFVEARKDSKGGFLPLYVFEPLRPRVKAAPIPARP
jgi:hypothetical protein